MLSMEVGSVFSVLDQLAFVVGIVVEMWLCFGDVEFVVVNVCVSTRRRRGRELVEKDGMDVRQKCNGKSCSSW